MQRVQCLEKLFSKPFGTLNVSCRKFLHLKPLINCCFVDVMARYALQTTHAVGVGGLFLVFYLFLGYLDLRRSQK